MKICLITDTHFGARGDSLIFHEYFMKFYNDVFFPYLEDNNINSVIHLGDVVDRRKFINFNILSKIRKDIFGRLNDNNIDTHIIIGNHDTFYKNTNEINSMNELFGDSKMDNIHIYDNPEIVNFDDTDILFLPWINSNNEQETLDLINSATCLTVMGHLEISGFKMSSTMKCDKGLSKSLFDKFDTVYSGHFHHKSTDKNITYLGNPYEITWIDYDDPRGFHIFDTETSELTFVKNPYKIFHKIFYDDLDKDYKELVENMDFGMYENTYIKVIVENKTNPYHFDKFMDELYMVSPVHIVVVEDIIYDEEDENVDLTEDTMTLLENYVDDIEIDTNKKVLKTMLKQLYLESMEIEV